ncbi:MAG: pyridoxal phosphate-dependent aminotransferase [Ignavibacteriales bacterium]|nr:pyridoxal phosphate-dependent aminotransferase [Ignavibacteriales bacterium]
MESPSKPPRTPSRTKTPKWRSDRRPESNPTSCGFRYDSRGILDALANVHSLQYRPDPKGLLTAREAVCEYYSGKDVHLDPEQILLTASTSEAYSFLFKLLCNAGDSILVPQPSYPLFDYLCQLNDARPNPYSLSYDGEWHIDIHSLKAQTRESRALILVHPNNPTGSYVKQDEKQAIVRFAGEKKLSLIVDEVFAEFDFGVAHRRAGTFATSQPVLTFTLGGISKLLGLPQMKLSWIVISGPSDLRNEALKRLELIADTYLSVHTAIQLALPDLLQRHSALTDHIRDRVITNFKTLQSAVSAAAGVSLFRCEAGWNAILRLPGTRTDEEWCEHFLQSFHTFFHPGYFYSLGIEGCLVLSLLVDPGTFSDAITKTLSFVTQETSDSKAFS